MFKRILLLFIRRMARNKFVAGIQILSLALANTAGILILLYTLEEVSFDKFHDRADRILRVQSNIYEANTGEPQGMLSTNSWPAGLELKNTYPEVEKVVYLRSAAALQVNLENTKVQENALFAGEDFLEIFSFPVLAGDPATALTEPYSIAITPETAERYFGDEDPVGQTLLMADSLNMLVTAVVESPPNSHIQFDILVSFSTYPQLNRSFSYTDASGWGNFNVHNYILLREGADLVEFKEKATDIYRDKVGEMMSNMGVDITASFIPVNEIYLQSDRGNGLGPLGSLERVQLIAIIGIIIILLACINFVNLSTARSVFRAREVGLRKVIGSTRVGLIRQFLGESYLFTLFSLLISFFFAAALLPVFNEMLNKTLVLSSLLEIRILLSLSITVLLVGLISGYYPAVVISRFKPSEILKGRYYSSGKGIQLRRSLVIFQFFICTILVSAVLLATKQINYMKDRSLGFNKEQLLTLDMRSVSNSHVQKNYEAIKNELASMPIVEGFSFTAALPARNGWSGQWATSEAMNEGENVSVHYMPVDEHYIPVLGIQLLAGRNFDAARETDLNDGLIINETAADQMGFSSPSEAIGKRIDSPSGHPRGNIIGVTRDYNQSGLQSEVEPIVLDHYTQVSKYFVIRFQPGKTSQLIAEMNELWKRHFPEHEVNYFFVDEEFGRQYQSEEKIFSIFFIFTIIGIVIAVIGLLGLVSFIIAARKKEIGIRKVLGADILHVTGKIIREFVILVIIANVIAVPLAWKFGTDWLNTFAYHTDVGAGVLAGAVIITLVVAVATVAYHAIKAGNMNPVDAIRSEN